MRYFKEILFSILIEKQNCLKRTKKNKEVLSSSKNIINHIDIMNHIASGSVS